MSLRQRLASGERLFGVFLMFAEPALVEIAGFAGFDFAILDTEHGPTGHEALQHCLRAGAAAGLECLVRVPQRADADIQRALDSGAAGIVAPHITSAAEAESFVAACRLPPEGRRGVVFSARSGDYGFAGIENTKARAAEVLTVAQIEDASALDAAGEIAGVAGLDCLFVGPTDLAASMGLAGEEARQAVAAAISERVLPAARAADRWFGAFVGDADEATALIADGAVLCAISGTSLIAAANRETVAAFRKGRQEGASA